MVIKRQQDVTPAVLEVMERTRDLRLREIMISLVGTCTASCATCV